MNYDERIRVLYVEDDPDSFDMLKVMLALAEIDLVSAGTVEAALTHVGSDHFDLYLLDGRLPDGNGFTLCRTLRLFFPKVPILFYSGNAYSTEIKVAMEAGADGYIIKPHSDKLAGTITRLVEARRDEAFARRALPVLIAAAA